MGTTFAIILVEGPAPVPEDDEDLLPQDQGDVRTQDQLVQEEEAGQVLLPLGGVYWELPVRQFLPVVRRLRTVSFS